MPLTTYGKNLVINAIGRGVPFSVSPFVALLKAHPTVAGSTASEVSPGLGYVRLGVSFGAASGGVAESSTVVSWPTASGAWGTVGWVALMDASSGGNMVAFDQVVPLGVVSGMTVKVLVGDLDLL